MPSIEQSKRLLKKLALINLNVPSGLAITPMLSGPHGIGKTQIAHKAAKELKGFSLVVEGGSLKEGEITGLPFITSIEEERKSFLDEYFNNTLDVIKETAEKINAYVSSLTSITDEEMKTSLKNAYADNLIKVINQERKANSEVRFTKYYIVKTLERLEKYYFEIASNNGLLDGRIKINADGDLEIDGKLVKRISEEERIIAGEENKYSILNYIPTNLKLELLESGEVKMTFLFIDELNRTEPQVMKELMNIVLNRNVNGYNFPWWTFVLSAVNPSSQSSVYAVNELDDAQRDRFLRLSVETRLEEWIDYGMSNGMDADVVGAIATAEDIFIHREKGNSDEEEMRPSPRSWEIVNYIYTGMQQIHNSVFLSAADRREHDADLRTLIIGKVGQTAARTFLQNIENKENNIYPEELINGKEPTIDAAVLKKFKSQKRLRQKVTADNVINYLARTIGDFEKKKKSADPAEKRKYTYYKDQIKEFTLTLDSATRIAFVSKIAHMDLFGKIADCFSTEVFLELEALEINLKDLNNSKGQK